MVHKAKEVTALPDFRLRVQFVEGVTKIYDVKPLFDEIKVFRTFEEQPELFENVKVDAGGYGIVWTDKIDLDCDEIFINGETIETPFDGLIAFTDATKLWGLNESTLRKAISYGKLVPGIDACKYGKQWVISAGAMEREYGEMKSVKLWRKLMKDGD